MVDIDYVPRTQKLIQKIRHKTETITIIQGDVQEMTIQVKSAVSTQQVDDHCGLDSLGKASSWRNWTLKDE